MERSLLRDLEQARDDAERKAWDSMCRYKFWMFGYWAAQWVHLNRLVALSYPVLGKPNPWRQLVKAAREIAPTR